MTGSVLAASNRKRSLIRHNRKHGCNIVFLKNLLEIGFCYAVNLSESCEVPAVCVVVNRNLITLIEDDVTWLSCNLLVVARKSSWKRTDLFKIAVNRIEINLFISL